MKQTDPKLKAARAALAIANRAFPECVCPIDKEHWPDGAMENTIALWRSRDFLISVVDQGTHKRMSVHRMDLNDRGEFESESITWQELQNLKTAIGYGDMWAVEVFPPRDEVVFIGSARHLWLLDEAPSYGWRYKPAELPAAMLPTMDAGDAPEGILRAVGDLVANGGVPTIRG